MEMKQCNRTVMTHLGKRFVITQVLGSREEAEDVAAEWRHFGAPCRIYSGQEVFWNTYESDDEGLPTLNPAAFIIAGPLAD
jgi:hypothetical protein